MQPRDLIIKYLDEARLMQIATALPQQGSNLPQPWVCTVYFAVDNLHNLFWLSTPDRRHSQEMAINPHVAGAITIPHTYGEPVRGLQFQGIARDVTDPNEIRHLFLAYGERYKLLGLGEDIISGRNPHHFYEIKPQLFVLFDQVNFPDQHRQEWIVDANAEANNVNPAPPGIQT